jgi:hypothetical protein
MNEVEQKMLLLVSEAVRALCCVATGSTPIKSEMDRLNREIGLLRHHLLGAEIRRRVTSKSKDAMKVKVGDTVYDGQEAPVMVVLTPKDKENIANMAPEATAYCCYPDGMDDGEVLQWMRKR